MDSVATRGREADVIPKLPAQHPNLALLVRTVWMESVWRNAVTASAASAPNVILTHINANVCHSSSVIPISFAHRCKHLRSATLDVVSTLTALILRPINVSAIPVTVATLTSHAHLFRDVIPYLAAKAPLVWKKRQVWSASVQLDFMETLSSTAKTLMNVFRATLVAQAPIASTS